MPTRDHYASLVSALTFATFIGSISAGCGGEDTTGPGGPGDAGTPVAEGGDGSPDATADADATLDDADATTSGCSGDGGGYPLGTSTSSVTVSGTTRTFRVHVPPGYRSDEPMPIVLVLHGGGGSGQQIEEHSAKMDPIADSEGFITVYPDGTGALRTWNAGLCCGKAVTDDIDDTGFMAALLDDVQGKLCTDARRVFVTGMSNGAIMSHRLACELSDRIAAIAPVAGTIGVPTCTPTSKVAVLEIHGTNDGHVPWDGGFGCGPANVDFTSVPATIDGWTKRNGCSATTAPYFQQGDGTCVAYDGCAAPVVLCTIQGGGHSWPGGEPKPSDGGVIDCPADGFQSSTFLASEAIWSFFKANPKAL